jgi:hypothetical protein
VFGVPFYELTQRQLILLDQVVDIARRSQLEITSTDGSSCFSS